MHATGATENDDPAVTVPAVALPAGIVLAGDERVLWLGRPRVREPIDRAWILSRLGLLAWLIVPTTLLVWSLGFLPAWVARPGWWIGVFAAVWLAAGLRHLTITPIKQARRRARLTYILTNVRAIIHEAGRRTVTESRLLDAVEHVRVTELGNGAADVWAGILFERIPVGEVPRLHAIALDAVRACGGNPLTPPGSATSAPPA